MNHINQPVNPYQDHGRLEQRSIDVFTPPAGLIHDPNLQQVARITRDREPLKPVPADPDHTSPTSIETTSIITSLDAETASPEDLLRTNRGMGAWTIATTATGMWSLPKTPVPCGPGPDPPTARA